VALALLLSSATPALAQPAAQAEVPRSAPLPPAFSGFSAGDVLARVFDGYDRNTGRVASILNEEKNPAHVSIKEAMAWRVAGQAQADGTVCGNCAAYRLLAVLTVQDTALTLVARGRPPKTSSGDDPVDDNDDDAIFVTGHSRLSLDLAPYRLSGTEMLIGLRSEHMWIPARTFTETLELYRIEGQRLRSVFTGVVADRKYPDDLDGGPVPIVKTASTVASVPSKQPFNDLRITTTVVRCIDRNEDWDCKARDEPLRRTRTTSALWRFDGKEFTLVK
jgi:hypothetical protein